MVGANSNAPHIHRNVALDGYHSVIEALCQTELFALDAAEQHRWAPHDFPTNGARGARPDLRIAIASLRAKPTDALSLEVLEVFFALLTFSKSPLPTVTEAW